MDIEFLIALPDTPYYLWQMLVQIANFRKLGYESKMHYLIVSFNYTLTEQLKKILASYEFECDFHVYPDLRGNKMYGPATKPFTVKQYMLAHQDSKNKAYFYTDPDVVFTKPMDFSQFLNDDIWYLSDTKSYLNSAYIKSKGEPLFYEMCRVAGIDPNVVINNDDNAGGAQWIIKNNDFFLWDEVERISNALYSHMTSTGDKYKHLQKEGDTYLIQAWTAEMWASIWVPWKRGIETKVVPSLDFSWANWPASSWETHAIHHNAGVVAEDGTNFCKVTHQVSPFRKEIKVSPDSIGSKYLELIRETEIMFPNLIW